MSTLITIYELKNPAICSLGIRCQKTDGIPPPLLLPFILSFMLFIDHKSGHHAKISAVVSELMWRWGAAETKDAAPAPAPEIQHPYAFSVYGPRKVPSVNWRDLIISSWSVLFLLYFFL